MQLDRAEAMRLASLYATERLDTGREAAFDHLVRELRELLDVPAAGLVLVDHDRVWALAQEGLPARETVRRGDPAHDTLRAPCPYAVVDARRAPRHADHPWVRDHGLVAYVGCAIPGPGGFPIGALQVRDRRARRFADSEIALVEHLARQAAREVCEQHVRRALPSQPGLATQDPVTGLLTGPAARALCRRVLQGDRGMFAVVRAVPRHEGVLPEAASLQLVEHLRHVTPLGASLLQLDPFRVAVLLPQRGRAARITLEVQLQDAFEGWRTTLAVPSTGTLELVGWDAEVSWVDDPGAALFAEPPGTPPPVGAAPA